MQCYIAIALDAGLLRNLQTDQPVMNDKYTCYITGISRKSIFQLCKVNLWLAENLRSENHSY
jgi:hypothetical protein